MGDQYPTLILSKYKEKCAIKGLQEMKMDFIDLV